MEKVLIIQTAFIGDVILATPVIEYIGNKNPDAIIDFLLRKGNESLLANNPYLRKVHVWDKNSSKFFNFLKLIEEVRKERYSHVINLHRFFSSGLISLLSGAKSIIGFNKNPLSFSFDVVKPHLIGQSIVPLHEVERNLSLVPFFESKNIIKPKLYPSALDYLNTKFEKPYITIAPGSVWYTKQWPVEKWIAFVNRVEEQFDIYLIGGKSDFELCDSIQKTSTHPNVNNVAGNFSFLASAALMARAKMNYVNDSAPLHIASAVNAPVTAIFCSTSIDFGFTPLSDDSTVLETRNKLNCRPCGLHGKRTCPKGHFKCADIDIQRLLDRVPKNL